VWRKICSWNSVVDTPLVITRGGQPQVFTTFGVVHEPDDNNVGLCRVDQSDRPIHRLSLEIGIRRVEALAEFALRAISGNEGVRDGSGVEGGACDRAHLVDGVADSSSGDT